MDVGLDSINFTQGVNETIISCEEDICHGNENSNKDPQIGMEFDSAENAFLFFIYPLFHFYLDSKFYTN